MQKKLIALAVAAVAAAPVFAQSNVTIYGQVRVSVDHFDMNNATGDSWGVNDQASRIGFKGAEDLGNGLKAVWQWESSLNTTNANGVTSGASASVGAHTQRNTFLGLAGGFGTVLFGTHDTPYKLGGSADLFGDTAADAQGTAAASGIIGRNGWDNRLGNVLAYVSPTWSGFHFAVGLVAGETAADNAAYKDADGLADAQSYVAVYENGPFKATLGHELVTKELFNSLTGDSDLLVKAKATKLNLGYKMGAIGLGYTYESSTAGTTSVSALAGGGSANIGSLVKDKGQLASISYTTGATTFGLQMGKFDDRGTVTTGDGNSDVNTWTVGAYHGLSKRTTAYIGYHNAKVKDGIAAGSDLKVKALTMGLNHSF
ncbi:MAG: porin [Candidatus Nitricoxidivorans perseverans]|uniref:Porin n=1 Tax=Candidatus Nitricoxidivorans perseverans TaxID=2975601 RepID=A0AA49FKX1_9PROT|nr:MAG: porin [Candidatus Nitricoxidivorans perseverans]